MKGSAVLYDDVLLSYFYYLWLKMTWGSQIMMMTPWSQVMTASIGFSIENLAAQARGPAFPFRSVRPFPTPCPVALKALT
jgi:hypothetical protein